MTLDIYQVRPMRDDWWGSYRLFVRGPAGRGLTLGEGLPNIGSFDSECSYNIETDKYNRNWLHVDCPHCGRRCSPFMTPYLVKLEHGWYWVGLDHKEPRSEWQARCPGCKGWYRFSTYIPQ